MCTTLCLRRPALRGTAVKVTAVRRAEATANPPEPPFVTNTGEVFRVGCKGEECFQTGLPDQHHAIPTLVGRADKGVASRSVELDRPPPLAARNGSVCRTYRS